MATPGRNLFAVAKAQKAAGAVDACEIGMMGRLSEKFGYYSPKPGSGSGVYAPLDILTDTLRSLSGMSLDLRRCPKKVQEALDAVYTYNYTVGLPKNPDNYGSVFFPLHLAPFMNEKNFAELFWKTWMRQITDYASLGIHSTGFLEQDWTRFLDYVVEAPVDTILKFEKGDPKTIKEKLGRRFILTGLFPLATLRECNKQQCIDKTKEYLDIMMPHGKFIFSFDKSALTLQDVNLENLAAVCQTVHEYGVYSNAGEKAGEEFHKEDYVHSELRPFTSKYFKTWEQYKAENPNTPESAKDTVMGMEMDMLRYVYGLCQ
jgi:hypothetical protein